VSKQWNPRKQTVELEAAARPSRIRREPVREEPKPLPGLLGKIDWHSREMEITLAIAGIILFALAIDALSIGISAIYN
jgi:hypothetical protein